MDLTDQEISAASERGREMFAKLLDDIRDEGHDPDVIAFAIWVDLTRYLAEAGWTFTELERDLKHHVKDQIGEGLNA
jgi:hypothetical protein